MKPNTITEKEYRDYLEFDSKLHELIEEKTKQLSMIQRNKLPKGIYRDCEFMEENGTLLVDFEYYSCGETDYDQFNLPLQFLFDETYPEEYRLLWEEQNRKEKEKEDLKKKKEDLKKKKEEENRQRVMEEYERKEYERLKLKFEKEELK